MNPITRAEFFKLLTLVFSGFFFSDEAKAATKRKRRKPVTSGTYIDLWAEGGGDKIRLYPAKLEMSADERVLIERPLSKDRTFNRYTACYPQNDISMSILYDINDPNHLKLHMMVLPIDDRFPMRFKIHFSNAHIEGQCRVIGCPVECNVGEPLMLRMIFEVTGNPKIVVRPV